MVFVSTGGRLGNGVSKPHRSTEFLNPLMNCGFPEESADCVCFYSNNNQTLRLCPQCVHANVKSNALLREVKFETLSYPSAIVIS